ncbi:MULTISPECIES: SHOCT domain-containing protein [Haloarcula]|uniref:SHOCT domain-containing protein n=1 Tax=Haloarcula TaxID=2237 RepID=UPI0023EA7CDE|nr:SHOCT domain-containing protein [Halomicroarcula sp. XH51]
MSSSNQLDTTTIVLLIFGAIIVLPLLTMGMGFGGMMGYGGTNSGWWPFVGMLVQIIFFLILLGGGYLLFRRANEGQTSQNPAMEELRTAYARGDLTDEEFESRRDKLERSE